MNKTLRTLTAAVVTTSMLALTACGGGGSGSTSTGGTYFTHAQLAEEFVRRVNLDIVGFDLELVKANTLQYNYIVVYDWDYRTYDAYYIGGYNVGENLANFINNNEWRFKYDLIPEVGGTYYDPVSGLRFEKAASSKNLSKVKAAIEKRVIADASERLQAEYGLSAEKATDAARFAYKLQNSPAGSYNVADYDAFAKQLVGVSITDMINAAKSGDLSTIAEQADIAANAIGDEAVSKIITDMMMN